MPHTSKEEDWEKEFYKKYGGKWKRLYDTYDNEITDEVKSFTANIRQQALTEQKMKFKEMVEDKLKEINEFSEDGFVSKDMKSFGKIVARDLLSELTNL